MIFLIVFLVGVIVGALLAYHFANVAELKRRAAQIDSGRDDDRPL